MLQTNDTGVCSQCVSHAGPAPTHGAYRSGSRLLCWESSEAGPGLHGTAGLSRCGSGTQVFFRGADSVGAVFSALPRAE